ncbi:protoporphyrinogen oxidase [Thermasporomyces composti]|jgi:oxygen-dependent protoporphyrinogen oxidase|uniref:Coproporphyrinogen III oxidase n=1 Tax=Thermasporomyces composti TaxID=696763 RepID=A0A3D9V8U0_THECX|nr:protoporphyrinogen oxidase [Thermasporomyces composti]REF38182.1 oxygen-dependent protoporphyrinogen oxidase [Thermasporomyces composti]
MAHVVVVGGGITGVSAAWFLRQAGGDDLAITLVEASARLGGKLQTVEVGDVPVDTGAEAMLNRRPEAVDLARAVGLEARLRYPGTTSSSIWSYGALRPVPIGTVMGVPADLAAVESSGVLSPDGVARVARDLELPGPGLDGDVSVGQYATERLGREIVDRLIEPLLGGVYAGHADQLSLRATMPQLVPFLRKDPSLVRAAARAKATAAAASASSASASSSDQPVFAGLDGGVGGLVPAVATAAKATVRVNATVRELRRTTTGWRLVVGSTTDSEVVHADGVVLACPAPAASRLLSDVAPGAAADLAGIEYASMATIVLTFPRSAFPSPLTGSGFLVPPVERRLIKAATFSSRKWPWLAERAPEIEVVRCSVGRHGETDDLDRDDADLVRGALTDLRDVTGVTGRPLASHVTRWRGGLPQYAVGHHDRVARIRAAVAALPGLAVAGAAYEGLGIPACVASARQAATQVLGALTSPERMQA